MYVAQDFYDPKNKDEAIFGKWSRIKAMFESAAKDPNDNQVSVARTCLFGGTSGAVDLQFIFGLMICVCTYTAASTSAAVQVVPTYRMMPSLLTSLPIRKADTYRGTASPPLPRCT